MKTELISPVGAARAVLLFRTGQPIHDDDLNRLYLDDLVSLFRPGDIVQCVNYEVPGGPYSAYSGLPLCDSIGASSSREARVFGAFVDRHVVGVPRWLVLESCFDFSLSYAWVDVVSLDGRFRGWLRDPRRWVRIVATLPEDEDG